MMAPVSKGMCGRSGFRISGGGGDEYPISKSVIKVEYEIYKGIKKISVLCRALACAMKAMMASSRRCIG